MQGLPSQLLSQKVQGASFGAKPVKAEEGVESEGVAASSDKDFGSLFEGMTAVKEGSKELAKEGTKEGTELSADGKSKELKGSKSDALKNLLGQKIEALQQSNTKKVDTGNEEEEEILSVVLDPKQAEALLAALVANKEAAPKIKPEGSKTDLNVTQKIAKTSNNLEQLLNAVKGNQNESGELEETNSDPLDNGNAKKLERSLKGELKSENPLEFLMKGAKGKETGEINNKPVKSSELESLLGQKKVMTGEDYLQNMESSEKKGSSKLALMNGLELPKNPNQNVKSYGQGMTLLSDPLIKNTKDLAFKDKVQGKASSDEMKNPDLKIGSEISANKQEVIPMMHNKENHGQQQSESQTQANQKVLDLGKLNTANTTEIIKRISDYVEQNQVANKSSLDLTVKHETLGEFKIQVSKMPNQSSAPGQNLIDMQITTSSKEGHDFFMKNEIGLMKNLNTAGINLSDLRIVSGAGESSTSGQTDSRQSGSDQNGNGKQFASSGSFSSEFSNGKEKRKELWEEYQQRYGA